MKEQEGEEEEGREIARRKRWKRKKKKTRRRERKEVEEEAEERIHINGKGGLTNRGINLQNGRGVTECENFVCCFRD